MTTTDSEHYLAVLKASYDYSPQSDDEIAIKEDQILFLIERTDDDWWKVKVKGDSQDADTPVGLVPAAYVEQAEHGSVVKALYDYAAAAPGELSIREDDVLLAFDLEDEWMLVQSQTEAGGAGFVPGNYVEAVSEDKPEPAPVQNVVVPRLNPRPVSTYVDPADRVAASKVTADDIKTWSVSEVDKKGKKKKGTLGIGNGSLFFASESDKTPVQKWNMADVYDAAIHKSKQIAIEIGGAAPASLLFHAGSSEHAEEIVKKYNSSKQLIKPPSPEPPKSTEKGTVRFSAASPTIIPSKDYEEEDDQGEEDEHPVTPSNTIPAIQTPAGEPAVALYEFTADGDDELTVAEGEALTVIERDGDEWWKCRNARGSEGVVPASYLELKSSSSDAAPISKDDEDEEARAAQEAADRAEAERLQREEEERAAKERKKQEAQRRAKEASAAAEAERQKRKEAAAASAKRTSSPRLEPPASSSPARKSSDSSGRKSSEVTFPPADKVRTWHDRSGQFRVDAALVDYTNGKLRLHKLNGVIVEVPSEKMSVEDMKYVEKLTRKSRPSSSSQRVSNDDDIPLKELQNAITAPSKTNHGANTAQQQKKGPKIDWFDFFLSAGCDMDDCTRYASAFERDKIDESILADITDSTMRSLGLREGDIIRVKKAIEKRKPGENIEKPSPYVQEQLRRDEELARQLQAHENNGGPARAPAPNLFAGPGGVLKNAPRRGRPQTTKTLPANVDLSALSSASEQIQRTSSPQTMSPARTTSSQSALKPNPTPPVPSTTPSSGFEDDAWTVRPSSAKPTTNTPPVAAPTPSTSAPATAAPPPVAVATVPKTNTTAPSPQSTPQPVATTSSPATNLAKTTESDIFNQLARLSQLRQATPQSAPVQQQQQLTTQSPTIVTPPGFQAGLGMGNAQIPIGHALAAQQSGLLKPLSPAPQPQAQPQIQTQPQQPYNGPRGPFAPVPANQGLLQPLIPTQTGFNNFIPTRPNVNPSSNVTSNNLSPFGNQTAPFLNAQPTGLPTGLSNPQPQPLMVTPTGIPPSGFGMLGGPPMQPSFQHTNGFSPVNAQPTGVFAQSPFNNPISPPPVPMSSMNSTSPADVFASMKSGTFAKEENHNAPQSADKYNALRPNIVPQPTGWNYGGYSGM